MKNLLVIVDMQNGFMNEHTKHLESDICRFIDANKDLFNGVVATQYVNNLNTPCSVFEGWTDCMDGTEDAELLPSIASRVDKVFKKDVYSCWEDMCAYVKAHEIDKLYFVGVNTGCCVLHSAFDFYNHLIDCSVISDLCGSTSGIKSHEAALMILSECITSQRVLTSEQAVKELS